MTNKQKKAVLEFARLIRHGSEEHRAWLMEAAQAFVEDRDLPEHRD